MTRRLYEEDSYCQRFDAVVLDCQPTNTGYAVELDTTAFFPEGGGQPADTGRLQDVRVTDVRIQQGRIWHMVGAPLRVGERVTGEIDWEMRFARMQKHTAEHVLSGIMYRRYGLDNVGFHLGSEDVTLDINGELSRTQLEDVELEANRIVGENRAVWAEYPSSAELATLSYRSKKELDGSIRIVTIEGVDVCACCAPHVRQTGEIGIIKILDAIRYKGGMRLHMQAGLDAVRDYQMRYRQMAAGAALLSVKQNNLSAAIERLMAEKERLDLCLRRQNRECLRLLAESVASTHRPVYLIGEEWDSETLREAVNALAVRCGGICAAFSGEEGAYRYALGGQGDVADFCRRMNEALSGRGGGTAQMMQGRVQATAAQIASFWADAEA
ncbi:MAG: alanyl-tRNA editing protein [Clostridia bacterium]|nr:alanyl-tRNA editing protein [Clostridia bacterium]